MEVERLTLVAMRYDKQALAPYEAAYQAESEGCYGTLGDALQIILHLSVQKDDAMKGLGGCFSNLSLQHVQKSLADLMTDYAPEPSPWLVMMNLITHD